MNGKNEGRKRTSSVVVLEEAAQELGVHALQVGEADVLVDPQAFDLVEHRRMRGVGIDAVGASRRDHLDRRLVHPRVAHLHRAGVRAQHQRQAVAILQVDVERVLHRARRMVLRAVERGEVEPVVLDLRTVGDLEADRAPDLLDALPGADHRMDAAAAAAAAGQRDVERLLGEARGELGVRQLAAPRLERRLDLLLGGVELLRPRPCAAPREPTSASTASAVSSPRLAEVARLRVLERRGIARRAEVGERPRDDAVEVLHY